MTIPKFLIVILISVVLSACDDSNTKNSPNFSIETNANNNTFKLGDVLELKINNLKNKEISGVQYEFLGQTIDTNFKLSGVKLGIHKLTAKINFEGKQETVSKQITILNNEAPKLLTFEIINTYPHDITSYTQGLEFYQDTLYESTGQYTESKLRKLDYKSGTVLKELKLEDRYFAEGLTILNDKIYQLTWRENTGFVYDINSFKVLNTFKYNQSKEGWGLCNDGTILYKSDGTDKIFTLKAETQAELDHIQVFTDKGKIGALNELEWIDGKIYANIYQRNGVVIINPENGATEAVIDFSSLKEKVTQHSGLDVLNGIAYNPETNSIFVTGKRWDKLFEVRIIEK
ncbi:glutaminyl-peptide cyclotransferase [Paucihalobacter sp.]|uniref:glutaminyl-peptide cyclotransferase n=1 Tax=Paucihalobacter sp. TaxID=2850405 RepID=UPI002FE0ECA6